MGKESSFPRSLKAGEFFLGNQDNDIDKLLLFLSGFCRT